MTSKGIRWKFPSRNLTTVIKNVNQLDKYARNRRNDYALQYYNLNQWPAFADISFKQLSVNVPLLADWVKTNIKTTTCNLSIKYIFFHSECLSAETHEKWLLHYFWKYQKKFVNLNLKVYFWLVSITQWNKIDKFVNKLQVQFPSSSPCTLLKVYTQCSIGFSAK
jgi:hypothetical protein